MRFRHYRPPNATPHPAPALADFPRRLCSTLFLAYTPAMPHLSVLTPDGHPALSVWGCLHDRPLPYRSGLKSCCFSENTATRGPCGISGLGSGEEKVFWASGMGRATPITRRRSTMCARMFSSSSFPDPCFQPSLPNAEINPFYLNKFPHVKQFSKCLRKRVNFDLPTPESIFNSPCSAGRQWCGKKYHSACQ